MRRSRLRSDVDLSLASIDCFSVLVTPEAIALEANLKCSAFVANPSTFCSRHVGVVCVDHRCKQSHHHPQRAAAAAASDASAHAYARAIATDVAGASWGAALPPPILSHSSRLVDFNFGRSMDDLMRHSASNRTWQLEAAAVALCVGGQLQHHSISELQVQQHCTTRGQGIAIRGPEPVRAYSRSQARAIEVKSKHAQI